MKGLLIFGVQLFFPILSEGRFMAARGLSVSVQHAVSIEYWLIEGIASSAKMMEFTAITITGSRRGQQ
jgi:hypothetical protein